MQYLPNCYRSLSTHVALVACVALGGCDILGVDEDRFVIRVDSMVTPANMRSTDTLRVRFHGVIGSDGCSRLDRVAKSETSALLEITFHGVRRSGSCTQMPVALDHVEAVPPPRQSVFTIRVQQPGASTLERVLTDTPFP
jgi:hypothetical protein